MRRRSCAEAVWWKRHRSLIADYLKAQGAEVIHILNANEAEPHPFTSAAKIVDGKLDYSGTEREPRFQRIVRASVPDADLKCRLTETLPAPISLDSTRLVKNAVQSA